MTTRPTDGPGGVGGASDPDPDELLMALRRNAGDPPLMPLRLPESTASARAGIAGRAVGVVRGAVMRLMGPQLADLLSQLERDRHRQQAEIERLQRRVAELERRS